jgi:hypothetical protein
MLDALSHGGNHLHAKGLAVEIDRYKIDVHLSTKALEITDEGVLVSADTNASTGDSRKLISAETVIYAVGQSPLQEGDDGASRLCAGVSCPGRLRRAEEHRKCHERAYEIARTIGRYGN